MLIINADDFGRSVPETDRAVQCVEAGVVTSLSAMVYMDDSERAAEIAAQKGLDVGLHINVSEKFNSPKVPAKLRQHHQELIRFFERGRYASVFYNPFLQGSFSYVFAAQLEEYLRIFRMPPSHFDGHQHLHLCSNLILNPVIPKGSRVRRSFSFAPGERSSLNRLYRSVVDHALSRRYIISDFFFCISHLIKNNKLDFAVELSRGGDVEVMTHPQRDGEFEQLLGSHFRNKVSTTCLAGYCSLKASEAL